MGALTSHSLLAVLILVSTTTGFASGSRVVIRGFETRHVELYNNLTSWDDTFTVHCKSKNDDLGTHVVPRGMTYKFNFKNNIWMTTLFFCGVTWEKGSATYAIYKAHRDLARCPDHCKWSVEEKGVQGFRQSDGRRDLSFPFT